MTRHTPIVDYATPPQRWRGWGLRRWSMIVAGFVVPPLVLIYFFWRGGGF